MVLPRMIVKDTTRKLWISHMFRGFLKSVHIMVNKAWQGQGQNEWTILKMLLHSTYDAVQGQWISPFTIYQFQFIHLIQRQICMTPRGGAETLSNFSQNACFWLKNLVLSQKLHLHSTKNLFLPDWLQSYAPQRITILFRRKIASKRDCYRVLGGERAPFSRARISGSAAPLMPLFGMFWPFADHWFPGAFDFCGKRAVDIVLESCAHSSTKVEVCGSSKAATA